MALHRRFDGLEKDVRSLELQQARFDERVKRLRDTQRFKLVGGPPAEEPDA